MLRLAGGLADGAVTAWTTADAIGDHVTPTVTRAAEDAGRPRPRIMAGLIVAVTDDPDVVRADVRARLGAAGDLPSYRAHLSRQGLESVDQTVLAGDEQHVASGIRAYEKAGATDLLISIVGDIERAQSLIGSVLSDAGE